MCCFRELVDNLHAGWPLSLHNCSWLLSLPTHTAFGSRHTYADIRMNFWGPEDAVVLRCALAKYMSSDEWLHGKADGAPASDVVRMRDAPVNRRQSKLVEFGFVARR